MASDLRILADDLTGALDSAAAFAGEVAVYFDTPVSGGGVGAVSAVSSGTRDVPPESLPARLAEPGAWLAEAGVAFKKVDSLLRGNTFAEVAWLAHAGRFDRVVFAPAFPAQGRFTVDGRLQMTGGSGARRGVSMVEVLAPLVDAGIAVEVPDVRSQADLLALAQPVSQPSDRQRRLWCGSAGLAHALAAVLGRAAPAPQQTQQAMGGRGERPLLLISASHQAVTRRQMVRLREAHPAALDVRAGDATELDAALQALQPEASGRSFGGMAFFDLSPTTAMTADDAQALLARQLDAIARRAPRPGVLVVVGGDTLIGLCRASGAQGLRACAAPRAGWGQARWMGGAWDGLACHSRSGAFGDEADLLAVVQALQAA